MEKINFAQSKRKKMFRLKMATDPRWVNIVEKNIHEILTDHAYCEQKAASNAISIVVKYPEHSDMVSALLDIAQEELSHFKMVHDKLLARNLTLGKERKDPYGRNYYWMVGEFVVNDPNTDTDEWALANNYASIVPVHTDLTAYTALEQLNTIEF